MIGYSGPLCGGIVGCGPKDPGSQTLPPHVTKPYRGNLDMKPAVIPIIDLLTVRV